MATRNVFTVTQFCERNPAWTPAALRDMIFHSTSRKSSRGEIPGNGFAECIIRVNGKVLIDEDRWFEILERYRQSDVSSEAGQIVAHQSTSRPSRLPSKDPPDPQGVSVRSSP
jgi:hypothetical protein